MCIACDTVFIIFMKYGIYTFSKSVLLPIFFSLLFSDTYDIACRRLERAFDNDKLTTTNNEDESEENTDRELSSSDEENVRPRYTRKRYVDILSDNRKIEKNTC